jgi:hypothetical protein
LPESSDTPGDELFHEERGLGGTDRLEANLTRSIGQSVDDEVVVCLEVATPIFGECEKEPVKMQNEPDAQLPWILLIQVVESAGVAGELGLTAVAEHAWRSGDEFGDPGIVDDDPFDRARCGDGFDPGLFSQGVEELRQLVRVAPLSAGGSVDPSQGRNDVPGDGVEGLRVLKAPHRTS